nr:MAG TPA: Methionine biosynthesis protein MetW [Caudoviricetes sp.]
MIRAHGRICGVLKSLSLAGKVLAVGCGGGTDRRYDTRARAYLWSS